MISMNVIKTSFNIFLNYKDPVFMTWCLPDVSARFKALLSLKEDIS